MVWDIAETRKLKQEKWDRVCSDFWKLIEVESGRVHKRLIMCEKTANQLKDQSDS